MRLLVYPHDLSIGGSQINAIDLAAGVAEAGHDVAIYGIHGPLVSYVKERGLRYISARRLKYRPAPSRIAQLAAVAIRERIDLIHAYEWPPCLDAYFGAGMLAGTRLLCTVLSMSVMPAIPGSIPLIMGTAELGEQARRSRTAEVWVLEPPIDTERDHPAVDGDAFRRLYRGSAGELLIVSVSRLALDLKLDALVRAIDAAGMIAGRYPVKLVLVGDGPAREALQSRAAAINSGHGREVVTLHGAMLDPRPAYAAADLVVGMGSSALRAMAIGRPVIVQGERAFSAIFAPDTLDLFLTQGFYGLADAHPGAQLLAGQMEALLRDADMRSELGRFGRAVVAERFSLKRAVKFQLSVYNDVLRRPVPRNLRDAFRSASRALRIEIDNHNPAIKRHRKATAATLVEAARGGAWPPAELA